MILPAKGQRTTEFWSAVVGTGVLVNGLFHSYDAAVYAGAIILASYSLARGIAKAGFGRASNDASRRTV
jgi:hypothetical protein